MCPCVCVCVCACDLLRPTLTLRNFYSCSFTEKYSYFTRLWSRKPTGVLHCWPTSSRGPLTHSLSSSPAVVPTCSVNEYVCASGGCVSASLRCDGHDNCLDGSDEVSGCCCCFCGLLWVQILGLVETFFKDFTDCWLSSSLTDWLREGVPGG